MFSPYNFNLDMTVNLTITKHDDDTINGPVNVEIWDRANERTEQKAGVFRRNTVQPRVCEITVIKDTFENGINLGKVCPPEFAAGKLQVRHFRHTNDFLLKSSIV
jgi:hypothetical protein